MDLLAGIVQSSAKNLGRLELTGSISNSLHHLEQLNHSIKCLSLHFYCLDRVTPFTPLYSIARLTKLQTLVLQQEFCHQETSAIEHDLLCAIIRQCGNLEKLEITGEYGWKLQLGNESLAFMARNAANLRHLALTGNSTTITDSGIRSLAKLVRLETLTLTSFDMFTDKSITKLIMELKHLKDLCLRDNCHLTIKTLEACVEAAFTNPNRTLNVHIDEKQMSASKLLVKYATNYIRDTWHNKIDPLVNEWNGHTTSPDNSTTQIKETICSDNDHQRWPANLNVVIDENLR